MSDRFIKYFTVSTLIPYHVYVSHTHTHIYIYFYKYLYVFGIEISDLIMVKYFLVLICIRCVSYFITDYNII